MLGIPTGPFLLVVQLHIYCYEFEAYTGGIHLCCLGSWLDYFFLILCVRNADVGCQRRIALYTSWLNILPVGIVALTDHAMILPWLFFPVISVEHCDAGRSDVYSLLRHDPVLCMSLLGHFFYIQRVFHWNNDLVLRFCFLLSKIELPPPPHLWIVAFAYVGIIQLPDGDISLLSFFWSWCITNICWTSNQLHRAVWFPHFDLNWSVAFSTQHLIWKGVLTWFSFIYWPPIVLESFFCLWELRRKDRQAYLCSIGRMGVVILTTS